jgi:general secretion pathway protein J
MITRAHRPRIGVAACSRGFTLIEILVAIAIFAFVGVMAMSGYTQLAKQSEYQQQRLERVREVQRAVQTLAQDLTQLEPRSIREPIGDQRIPALLAGDSVEYKIEFTRAGWTNTAGLPRPTLQRVAYRLDQDGLWRDHWRYMSSENQWLERWPAPGTNPAEQDRARPAAIEVTLDLEDWGEIKRLIEVAG